MLLSAWPLPGPPPDGMLLAGAGFDSIIAAGQVGPGGQVAGGDMTSEMLAKSRQTAEALALTHVEFREGFAESGCR